ncbi:MAG: RhuM family protein, partial [Sulfuricaulis sp.]|uniref:RhuM family protein n=1 Tax=Sulfuricaulis sp. TaxID=2003553 RepID=UPI003C69403E
MNSRENKLSEVVLYRTKDGKTALDVRLEGDTVWLTQAQMAKLFENTKQNISLHTRNIFREGELAEKAVIKESLTTAPDGKKYRTKYFNLDVIISVGYRVKSKRGTRIPVELILRKLGEGATEADLLDAYPDLTRDDVRAAMAYAADTLAHEETIIIEPPTKT